MLQNNRNSKNVEIRVEVAYRRFHLVKIAILLIVSREVQFRETESNTFVLV